MKQNDEGLRRKLIRLAYENPDLRPKLLPLLREARMRSNPATDSFKGLSQTLRKRLQEATAALEDVHWMLNEDWGAYVGEEGFGEFLQKVRETERLSQALWDTQKVESAWSKWLKIMR
jgi:hypothetical protein